MLNEVSEIIRVIGEPRCAQCRTPVEWFEFDVHEGNVTFTAMCHGEQEVVSFTLEEFLGFKEVEYGLAFADPQTDSFTQEER